MSSGSPPPSWPSLYNFIVEILPVQNVGPVQPEGRYLYAPDDIYHFTLYWTLVFYTPAFMLCGLYAFLNLTFTPHSRVRRFLFLAPPKYAALPTSGEVPLKPFRATLSPVMDSYAAPPAAGRAKTRHNERRSRLTFALIVAFVFAVCAVGGAVLGSAVLGYVMAGLFKAAGFHMSTWIPFFLGLMQTVVGLLGLWPSVVDII